MNELQYHISIGDLISYTILVAGLIMFFVQNRINIAVLKTEFKGLVQRVEDLTNELNMFKTKADNSFSKLHSRVNGHESKISSCKNVKK